MQKQKKAQKAKKRKQEEEQPDGNMFLSGVRMTIHLKPVQQSTMPTSPLLHIVNNTAGQFEKGGKMNNNYISSTLCFTLKGSWYSLGEFSGVGTYTENRLEVNVNLEVVLLALCGLVPAELPPD